jgi:phage tail sheath protein FI|nr:MAG TPA: tail sheath protein [Caudoviricetes sp.]
MGEYKTPGVYIKEKNAFGNSVVEAETAIPVFIGFTEETEYGNESLENKPIRITSMTEYHKYFGGAKIHKFNVSVGADVEEGALVVDQLQAKLEGNLCTLYYHLTLFFANGGSTCYVVSVGDYDKKFADAYTDDKKAAVYTAIKKIQDITMLVVPEAVNDSSCMTVYTDMLGLCESKKYFAILDIPTKYQDGVEGDTDVEKFRTAIGTTNLQFAAAYYPWLDTSVLSDNDINGEVLIWKSVPDLKSLGDKEEKLKPFFEECMKKITEKKDGGKDLDESDVKKVRNELHNALYQNLPVYKQLADKVKASLNHLPPSAAMAGIYAMVDRTRGVWKAPANVSVNYVNKPAEVITDYDQENLNMPMNGKAVNAIRTFPGEGIKVWGARTLDGNSNDWRYINVRRTMTFLEQSVKNAARAYVFEPNDASTWINMKCMIENFLRSVWKRGGLAGSSPEDAYEVHIGLGDTMTAEDILEGTMRITVLVAISRPAEFIEITFQQQMQKS